MRFEEPSVEYWPQEPGIEGIWKQIARATKVSYQSQGREGESDLDFVKRVIFKPALIEGNLDDLEHCKFDNDKMHGSCLEAGTVYLTVPPLYDVEKEVAAKEYEECFNIVSFLVLHDKYTKHDGLIDINGFSTHITTNMRVIVENNFWPILKYLSEPTKQHERRYTFCCNTDIGVSREANRHRAFSIIEESTRYCAYDKGKFNGEITYSRPAWMPKEEVDKINNMSKKEQLEWFYQFCRDIETHWVEDFYRENGVCRFALMTAEWAYMVLRSKNVPAERCRQVLNLNTKTQVVYTAFKSDWEHFLKLRADNYSGKAHPNIQVIAQMIKEKLSTLD